MRVKKKMVGSKMLESELFRFASKFLLLISLFVVVFYFVFPYYRIGLRRIVDLLFGLVGVEVQYSESVKLGFMPYVSLSALILATPRKGLKEKLIVIMFSSLLFFFIDIVFSILQISFASVGQSILLFQELLIISLPIIIWWYFSYSIFKN